MSTEQARFHLSSAGQAAYGQPEHLTYYDQCGWNGYEWKGILRRQFLFSDSKVPLIKISHTSSYNHSSL